jgi:hypothetical protein
VDLAGAVGLGTDPELYALKECGKRAADVLNNAVIDNGLAATGRWMAFRLDDGSSDKVIYDTRDDAIRHQLQPAHYEQLKPHGYSPDVMAMTLHYARAMHSAGLRPHRGDPAPILPVRREDAAHKAGQMNRHARRSAAAAARRRR